MPDWAMQPIGFIQSPYAESSQVPKGLGTKHTAEGVLEVLPEFQEGLQDIEGFSHLIIVWVFHRSEGFDLVGLTPADKYPHGVFATHSPRRPNPIGITTVELTRREGGTLYLRGIDMLAGTPVLDIKPCTSSVPWDQLRRGWLAEAETRAKK
ncbi:MAG TPA: tRNA (N6-threonylcarbamoyladenosine(37)-N6)-methyltransferase TrmO [Acidobacteriota bacterium]|nr:tRNA (N6-threonylcarbamoyladenosine(37)-N6)-methyltransferase TrmO [Acidobacteriota bacterium]